MKTMKSLKYMMFRMYQVLAQVSQRKLVLMLRNLEVHTWWKQVQLRKRLPRCQEQEDQAQLQQEDFLTLQAAR